LETRVELDPNIRQLVLENAATLIPPRDDDQARMIAKAGNPATSLLHYNSEFSTEEITGCVKALALIGTLHAMRMLVEYTQNKNERVQKAIGEAWEYFDRTQYAEIVLKHSEHLYIKNLSSWEGFESLHHITKLQIDAAQVDDFTPLTQLPALRELNLSSIKISDLSSIANLKELRILSITATTKDLTPLNNLECLERLEIYGPNRGSELSVHFHISVEPDNDAEPDIVKPYIVNPWLLESWKIEGLSVTVCGLEDFHPLKNLTRMRRLEVLGCPQKNLVFLLDI
jgi:hypothetical protein